MEEEWLLHKQYAKTLVQIMETNENLLKSVRHCIANGMRPGDLGLLCAALEANVVLCRDTLKKGNEHLEAFGQAPVWYSGSQLDR